MSAFENDYFVQPVEGKDDLFKFSFDFGLTPEGKAGPEAMTLDDASITETAEGDLIIEGWAANFEGYDRQGENFLPGAFQRGVKAFLDGGAPLCFHHQRDKGIGRVLDLKEDPDKGLWMRARVDHQPESSPLRYIYNAVKKGSYKGLSVGGFFRRAAHKGRQMIADMDFTEISVTPVAVHPKTAFGVVAGKALASDLRSEHANLDGIPQDEIRDEDFEMIQHALNLLDNIYGALEKRGAGPVRDNRTPAVEAA